MTDRQIWHRECLRPTDLAILNSVMEACGRRRFLRKRCFPNAQLLALQNGRLEYAEGIAQTRRGTWVHHGWNVLHGAVVDVTWREREPAAVYYGQIFDRQDVSRKWASPGRYKSLALLDPVPLFREVDAL